jgi:hypothetical protein
LVVAGSVPHRCSEEREGSPCSEERDGSPCLEEREGSPEMPRRCSAPPASLCLARDVCARGRGVRRESRERKRRSRWGAAVGEREEGGAIAE